MSGRSSLRPPPVPEASQAADASLASSSPASDAPFDATPPVGSAPLAQDVEPSSALAELVSDAIANRSVSELALRWSGDPKSAVATIVDQLSDRELIAAVSSLSDFAGRDIAKRKDKRRYVARLSEIALDGIATEPSIGGGEVPIEFATHVDESHAPADPRQTFGAADEKIYAVFPNEAVPSGPVVVKWTRTDNPELLLFDKYPLNRQQDHSYVWFRPDQGFPPGDYQVDFFSANGDLDHLGSGTYRVEP